MSKFTRPPLDFRAGSLTAELLDQLLDLRGHRRVGVQLQEALIRSDRRLRVAGLAGRLAELAPRARLPRLEVGDPLVGGDRVRVRELDMLVEAVRGGIPLRGCRLLDSVSAD